MHRHIWTGIAGPTVYAVTVLAGGAVTQDYSHLSQAVSELTQRGAAHAGLMGAGFAISALLCALFGLAIRREPGLRLTGLLLVSYGVMAFLLATILPMDPIGDEVTVAGMLHIVFVAVSGIALMAAIIAGGSGLRHRVAWFLPFSIGSVLLMIAGGAAAALALSAGLPWTGLAERVTLTSYLVWIAVLAFVLIQDRR